FTYDAKGRLTSETTPEAGKTNYTYTDFDAVASRTDARGVVTTYTYGELNWLTGMSYNTASAPGVAATAAVGLTYKTDSPGKGQIKTVTDGVGSESYDYDSFGRLQSRTRVIDGINYQTQYEYNAIGQTTLMIYPSGRRVKMSHDGRGRLSALQGVDSAGGVQANYLSGINYRVDGQVSGLVLGDGATESYGYSDDRLQLTSQTVTNGNTTLLSLSYGYGAGAGQMGIGSKAGNSGQLVSVSGTINGQNRNQSFTYDNVGRLVTATGWGSWARRFDYDRYGNRTAVWDAVSGGNQLQNTALEQVAGITTNRIASVNDKAFSYDASGNTTVDGANSYTYDAENRIVSVGTINGGESYAYDARWHRVKKVVGGVVTYYIWEGDQVIAEYERGGVATPATGTRYYHPDRLSTRLITAGAGNVVGTTDQLPFGEELSSIGESEKHKFTSYERDDSGLDYAVNRHYNSEIGRFMQPDPVGIGSAKLTDPQTLNRYAYVKNDPINKVDPLGLLFAEEDDFEIEGGGGGGGWYIQGDPGGAGTVQWVNSGDEVPDGYNPYTLDWAVSYDSTQALYLNPDGPDPTAPEGSDASLGILSREDLTSINIDSSEQELTDFAKGVINQLGSDLEGTWPIEYAIEGELMFLSGLPLAGEAAITELGIEVGVAEGSKTLYHGTSGYTAMEAVENQAINIDRLAAHQADKAFAPGLYTTSEESTAAYYADLNFNRGQAGGPAILKIEMPTSVWEDFTASRNISIETPVPRMPGQTETFIPIQHLPAFNDLPGLKFSIHK
ncbi:MAG: RHS repeat-associated core domain-containing protein, partial [Blastocatellia bacterium]|nr:RHS repeat-associated core domain-containing protein [Blastocatellia bacterium]